MSAWHRDHPELVGTDADPWMAHESYRRATEQHRREQAISARRRTGMDCANCGAPEGVPCQPWCLSEQYS